MMPPPPVFLGLKDCYIMPPIHRAPEALCFRVVRPYGNLVNIKSQEPLFIILGPGVHHDE